jgi:hypothetical protein
MAYQAIGRGTSANDGTGDDLRSGAGKINANFVEVYTKLGDGSTLTTDTVTLNTATQTLTNKTLTAPTITGAGAIAGVFTGNITGNVTGNVTGDLTGNVTGNVTGDVTGDLTGDVTGNADTATSAATLTTPRTIAGVSFDGSANITIASTDLSDTADIVLAANTITLTNKTLTSPVLGGTATSASGNIVVAPATNILEVQGDGASVVGQLQLNCHVNSHGQIVASQPHSEAATNTLTLPGGTTIGNADATLVSDTGTQTLTNKSLTSPTITGTGAIAAASVTTSNHFQAAVYADTSARDGAIASPTAGMVVYLTATNKLQVYTGSAWETITSA